MSKDEIEAREVESILSCLTSDDQSNQRLLDKLPPDVWDKILDELKDDDLFPLALSCRYFRQVQKELVARTRQSGAPRLAFKTNLKRNPRNSRPVSVDYLRFCSKETVSKKRVWDRDYCIIHLAAFHGHLPLLQELLEPLKTLLPHFYEHLANTAVSGGQLETLQWARAQMNWKLDSSLFNVACLRGDLEILKWLRSEGCPWDSRACSYTAQAGHLQALRWLRSEGCPWNGVSCYDASTHGHFEVLKYLKSEGCPLDTLTFCRAAGGGHLEMLKWLRSEGCPWGASACASAARHGHLEVLKWLRSEGCPWDENTCASAARHGHLEVLKWLRSEGCPWDENTCEWAARGSYLDVLRWAIDNGCPYEVNGTTRPALKSLGLA